MKLQILRLLVGLAVLGVLLAVIWLLGSLLTLPRNTTLAIMLGVTLVFLALVGLAYLKSLRGAASIEQSLKAQALAQFAGARPDKQGEVDELRKQFESALDALRRSKRGKTALHSLPLYVLVGPPGSGKTTMLRESGIEFPFMAGRREIRGVGGTRNCDWWFGARGIMLDTAGRYMVEEEDREEWIAFLGMIRRARGRRAIDGAVVAISLGDVLSASDLELRSHAEMVRERIDELTQQLGVVFPVYLVFTKCDQLAGFVEFFERLGKDERKQTFGFSVPLAVPGGAAAAFVAEFDLLYRGLGRRRVQDFGVDRGRKKKEKSYAFPLQFALTRQRISDFLGLLGQANPYQEASPLRGVYFTSGTQEGTVISQLQRKIYEAAEMAIDVPPDQRKCYFVDDLFEKVVFGDVGLAQPTAAARRRLKMLRIGGAAAAALLGGWLLYASVGRFADGQTRLSGHEAAVAALQPLLADPWRAAQGSDPRHLRSEFVAAFGGLATRVGVDDTGGAADATDDAVRGVLHHALRVSFVRGCVEAAIAGADANFVSLITGDGGDLDYASARSAYDRRNADLEAWIQTFQALTRADAKELGPAARDKLQTAWIGCLAADDAGAKADAERWLGGFLAARSTNEARLLAVGDRSRLQETRLVESRGNAATNIGKLFSSFVAMRPDDQLRDTFRQTTSDAPKLHLDEIVGGPTLGSECLTDDPGLPAFLARPGGKAAVDGECARLRNEFHTGNAQDDERRARDLESVAAKGHARLAEVRSEAWTAYLAALQPRLPADGRTLDRWVPTDPAKASPVDTLARRIERAFELPEPAAGTRPILGSLHRDTRAQIDALRGKLNERKGVASGVVAAVKEFLADTKLIRNRLEGGYNVEGVGRDVGRAVAGLEQRVVAMLERASVADVVPELQNAWDKAKPGLVDALNKFPFLRDQSVELTVTEFQKLFADGSAFAVLDEIVATGRSELGDGKPMFQVTDEAEGLLRRLAALRKAFLVGDTFAPKLEAKTFNSQAAQLEIRVLETPFTLRTARDFYEVAWLPKSDLVASITMTTQAGTVWNLKALQRNPHTDTEFRGLWSLVRLCARGRTQPSADHDRIVWAFGNEGIQVGLVLKRDAPLSALLLDVEDAFFNVKIPTLLFQPL